MQTALAVRDTVMTVTDMFMYVAVYFITSGIILFNLDSLLLIPFIVWFVLVWLAMWYFIPKLKQTAIVQADARALMTGRITDAYANIMTVKLFSHRAASSIMPKRDGTVFRYGPCANALGQLP